MEPSPTRRPTREEQALAEMESTSVDRPAALFLLVSFLSLLAAVPLVDGLAASARPSVAALAPRLDGLSAAVSLRGMLDFLPRPAALRGFEDDLEEASAVRDALLPPAQRLLLRAGAGNERAYPGRDGWLFYRPDVDHVTAPGFLESAVLAQRRRSGEEGGEPPQPDPVEALVEFRRQLAERGVDLVVIPTPLKPTLCPERLSSRYDGRALLHNPSYQTFLRRLEENGVVVVDPSPVLARAKARGEAVFLETDTHWTPAAVELVAREIAAGVRERLGEASEDEVSRRDRTVANTGDIARILYAGEPTDLFDPEEVDLRAVATRERSEGERPEVLFLGDSFANIYSLGEMGWGTEAGLVEQLEAELRRPIDRIVINDGGSHATRRQLSWDLRSGRDRLSGVKLVLYQFADRELSFGDWRHYDLRVGTQREAVASGAVRVTGRIHAVATPPRPGTVPYRDLITSLHLVDVQGEGGEPLADRIVFRWGMRDGAWTSAARTRAGERASFDLVPWEEVSAELGGFNRAELDDEELWELDVYWAPLEEPAPDASPVAVERASLAPVEPATGRGEGAEPSGASSFPAAFLEAIAPLTEREVVRGRDGWLLFGPELRHLSAGAFWGDAAPGASRAANPEWSDPLPAIVDFHEQLERAGIELWLAAVPPKAVVHPEAVVGGEPGAAGERLDVELARFLAELRARGVRALDLTAWFLAHRRADERALYCRQDTHWSPLACELVARRLAEEWRARPWFDAIEPRAFHTEERETSIEGDLWRSLAEPRPAREVLTLRLVLEDRGGRRLPVEPWRESPVLVLGDSHALVFHAGGDLLASGAGLADQLAYELGFPVDLVGVRGSGATAARLTLLRRRDELAGKRIVLWVFTARELTESVDGWRHVPIIRRG